MTVSPQFPPLLTGEVVPRHIDPFNKAVSRAIAGVDSGMVFYSEAADTLRAALVLAPETTLEEAVQAVYVAQIGLAESLGALAPPEVPVHFQWPDRIKVNGALCGSIRFAADVSDPLAHPNWLVIGITVPFIQEANEPGDNPDETCLYEEGCVDMTPMALLESWSKHTLLWLTYFMDSGFERVHKEWRPRCDTLGKSVERPRPGLFVGLDEKGRMLLRQDVMTETLSLIEFAEHV
ncbi:MULTISPECIES: biotin/lipoate--protein ligase family protein [unclassified Marinobacter]|uniref:biotin/lipoate--protein ligase family protein n=1 Tax=unclassified Marinobacter TaxID=83889 RepID=UPI001903B00C|nr:MULTISPECIES: biotin/lipoate--protein ligase family protein [unclassified Marinobacter]MBK1873978.1 biotin/lipoate--protein ligase family protein [Marinobacter sp. 1-3A]MBK1887956.1 biotin/lipoate--protein ligase family protein [Marinobacter sp. DY40_1A1]